MASFGKSRIAIGLVVVLLGGFSWAHAQTLRFRKGALLEERVAPRQIEIVVGKSKLLDSAQPIQRVSITETKIADVVVVSPHQVLINGKKVGATNMIVWTEDGQHHPFDIRVVPDVDAIRTQLDELVPGHRVNVSLDGVKLVLSGEVTNLETMERILGLVKPHAPELVNLIKVKSPQQVQLHVRIALVSRPALREAGITFTASRNTQDAAVFAAPGSSVTSFETGTVIGSIPPGPLTAPVAPAFSLAVQLADTALSKNASVASFLSLLESQGFAKTLAEPTLVTVSGHTASFLSGGEFPIPIVTEDAINVEFKQFGVRLRFTPTVLGDETIWLRVAPEVSEVSFDLGVAAGALTVPGITAQKAETTIQLKDGQTFVIAGLLQDKIDSQIQKIPLLGDLPIIGALFRQVRHSRTETELLITVTPRLVKPLGPEEIIPLPGDEAVYDPDDFELFLLGRLTHFEVKKTEVQKVMKRAIMSQAGPGGYLGFIH